MGMQLPSIPRTGSGFEPLSPENTGPENTGTENTGTGGKLGEPTNDDIRIPDPQVFGGITPAIAGMLPDFLPYKTERDLVRCGYYHPKAYENYLAIRNALVVCTILVLAVWLVVTTDTPSWTYWLWIGGVISLVLVFAIPRVFLSFRGESRVDEVLSGLPDALDTLVMGMSGGLSLEQSLQRAGIELADVYPSLSRELDIIHRQTDAYSLEFALERFAQRMDLEEITTLTDTIRHSLSMGSPMVQVLRSNADHVRLNRMQRAQQRGNTISLKILFPTILCLAPAAFIVILSPPLLELRAFRDREKGDKGALNKKGIQNIKPKDSTGSPAGL